jgi:hypothetical protein
MIAWIVKQSKHCVQCYFFPFFISLLLTSCSIVGTPFKATERMAEYAELLFKRQNFLTQQLMMLFEEDLGMVEEERVSQAELQMYDACHLLNEYANKEMEGEKMSIFFRRRVKNSFASCDESVKNMGSILMEIDESIEITRE